MTVPGCWSIRPTGPGGRGEIEQAWPDPEPAPVTTIAWRLSHLAVGVFGLRASHHFGDGSLTHDNAERPLTAKDGVAYFTEQVLRWRSHIGRLDEEELAHRSCPATARLVPLAIGAAARGPERECHR
jgi:hypothetical protein